MATSPPVLDLVSANCLEFMLTASSKPVSDEITKQVTARMQETACQEIPLLGTAAQYGSIYSNGLGPVVAVGSIFESTKDDAHEFGATALFRQAEGEAPTPPDTWKPFSDLLEVATLLGALDFQCEAEYVYELSPGLQSRIDLPSPLLIGRPDDFYGFTHIESATLSKREGKAVEHSVQVASGEGRISHKVRFVAGMAMEEEVLRDVFDISARLSTSLLYSGENGEEEQW